MLLYLFGLAALAGGVYLLQRLRIERTEREVPTLIFWRAALRETQARRLSERFRDPLVFLLLFAIAGLLWTAAMLPRGAGEAARDHWVMIDGSAAMTRGARVAAAEELARAALAEAPAGSARAWALGSAPTPLLLAGEELPLFDERFGAHFNAAPPAGSAPQGVVWLVEQVAARAASGAERGLTVALVATPPVLEAARPALDELIAGGADLTVRELTIPGAELANEGILDLRAEPAASGAADRADIWVRTSGADARLTAHSQAGAGGVTAALELQIERSPSDPELFVARDLPLAGQRLTARVTTGPDATSADELTADDVATLDLPVVAPVRVALAQGPQAGVLGQEWRSLFDDVLASDTGLTQSAGSGEVTLASGAFAGSGPALVVQLEAPTGGPTLRITGPDADVFAATLARLGLDQIPSGLPGADQVPGEPSVAGASAEALTLDARVQPGPRRLELPGALAAPPIEWRESRELPLLIALATRWLAGVEAESFRGAVSTDIVGPAITLEPPTPAAGAPASATRAGGDWRPWLALLALGLLLFEWAHLTRGRMP